MTQTTCPLPKTEADVITQAHGSGGKQTSNLIQDLFLPAFSNDKLAPMHDGAHLSLTSHQIAFTTDSYVVTPHFFPGGDIGKLAAIGTMNDLAMCGARPAYLSCGFIIEEGFSKDDLKRIIDSLQAEASAQDVQIVTGDTKVIERTNQPNIYINTSGIGQLITPHPILPARIQEDDAIIVSGDIGRHGMAIMAAREGFAFNSTLTSDCAPLFPLVEALLNADIDIHCLRDLTRGGLATALVELSESARKPFSVHQESIPVNQTVQSACEILGFDPLFVANEGRFALFLPEAQADNALAILRTFPDGENASRIGTVKKDGHGVTLRNNLNIERPLHKLSGGQLPRIC